MTASERDSRTWITAPHVLVSDRSDFDLSDKTPSSIKFKRDADNSVSSGYECSSSSSDVSEYSFYVNMLPDKHSTPFRSLFCDASSFSQVNSIHVLVNGVRHPLVHYKHDIYHCNIFFYPGSYTISFFVNDEPFINPLYTVDQERHNVFSSDFLSRDQIYYNFLHFVFSPLCLTTDSYLFKHMEYREIRDIAEYRENTKETQKEYILDFKYFSPILEDYGLIFLLKLLPNNSNECRIGIHNVWVDTTEKREAVHKKDFKVLRRREVRDLYAEVYPINDDPSELIKYVRAEFNAKDGYVFFKDGSFRVIFLFNSNDDVSAFVIDPYLIFNDRRYLITRDFFSDDVCDDDVDILDDSRDHYTTIEEQLKDMIDSPIKIPPIRSQQLPIFLKYDEILDRVDSERVCVLVGSTGCGKSTQLPVYLAELYSNSGKRIAITQPCALTTMTIYNRISIEYKGYDGAGKPIYSNYVGYLTESGSQDGSQIMVIQEDKLFSYDPLLSEFSVLIIDEVHIRSVSTDIILGIARDILSKRADFRVVICSATIDTSKYINYFFGDNSSILPISVPGRFYDVRVVENPVDPNSLCVQLHLIVKEAIVNPAYYEDGDCTGHVLVFVPSVESVGQYKLEFYECFEPINSDLISLVLIFQRLVKLKGVKFPNSVNKNVFRSIKDMSKSIDSAFLKINDLYELNKNISLTQLSFDENVIPVINKCLLASFGNTMYTNIPHVSNVLVSNDQKSVLQVHPVSFFLS
ncbi:hypothetical protein GEMRC1_011506 [Eukaryota sp. GEM-RC1]